MCTKHARQLSLVCFVAKFCSLFFAEYPEVQAVKAQPYTGKWGREQQLICNLKRHARNQPVSPSTQNRDFQNYIINELRGVHELKLQRHVLGRPETYITILYNRGITGALNQICFLSTKSTYYNIYEGSCETENWSNDENSALPSHE